VAGEAGQAGSGEEDKFLQLMDPPLTYKRWSQQRNQRYIGILRHLKKDIGEERLLELLKKASYADNVDLGRRLSGRIKDMNTFAAPFRNDKQGIGRTLVCEIIEDNEKAFEMKITRCLTEEVFREADACDLGYACVCHADYGLPEGLGMGMRLIRSKTLMEGHDCCNHRYVLED
ncbi:MAG TPA: L-2-amino-thiazoline-4-carboxylic acid hydrolase, partial [Candidatus Krumholzibacterium sp.]|nr:L-2-amino-thiazoline-4-carboxylic acid hydrolase [Candidatus Krumholzibacterium sp.]